MTPTFVYLADYNTPFIDNPEIDLYNCNNGLLIQFGKVKVWKLPSGNKCDRFPR